MSRDDDREMNDADVEQAIRPELSRAKVLGWAIDQVLKPSAYAQADRMMRWVEDHPEAFDDEGRLKDMSEMTKLGMEIPANDVLFPVPSGIELRESEDLLFIYHGDDLLGCLPCGVAREVAERIVNELARRYG